jgi:hypothetical protein
VGQQKRDAPAPGRPRRLTGGRGAGPRPQETLDPFPGPSAATQDDKSHTHMNHSRRTLLAQVDRLDVHRGNRDGFEMA